MNMEARRRPKSSRSFLAIIACSLAAWLMAFGAAGRAAEQQSGGSKPAAGGSRSLDQELLEDLDNELLDGTSKKLPPPKTDMPAGKRSGEERGADKEGGEKPSANSPPGDDPDAMGEDIGQGPEDPLTRIGREMRVVERLIAEKKAAEAAADSVKAGQLQDKIVDELAKLIETLEKQQQQQQQSSAASGKKNKQQGLAGRQRVNQPKSAGNGGSQQAGSKNNQPARDSTERLSKNETQRPDMGQMKGLMKDLWGQLPAHAREQMLQTSPEQFLPRYELQLEKYYKRLAEQQKEPH